MTDNEDQIVEIDVSPEVDPEIDRSMVEKAMQQYHSEQSLAAGIAAGLAAAIVGAAAWAAITITTGVQIGWMSVGIGFLVGISMRVVGKGIDKKFGIAGAIIALAGCLVGNILSVTYFVAEAEGMGIFEVLSMLTPSFAIELLTVTFSPMDLLFYGIAVYEGYRLSFREITEEQLMDKIKSPG